MLAWQLFGNGLEPMTEISPRYTVTDLGVLPGFAASRATALNDRGQVIGSLSREDWDFSPAAFLWSEGRMRELGNARLQSINNKGQTVGAKCPEPLKCTATLYSAGRFQEMLKNTPVMTQANHINDCSQAVGYLQATHTKNPADKKRRCFVWKNGRRRYLSLPEGYTAGDAVAINNAGLIAGQVWNDDPNDCHAALWDNERVIVVDEPAGYNTSQAVALNASGDLLIKAFHNPFDALMQSLTNQQPEVTWQDSPEVLDAALQNALTEMTLLLPDFRQRSFFCQNGQMHEIDGLAAALNDQSQVVGWSGCTPSAEDLAASRKLPYAFFWQNGELFDLNDLLAPDAGWRLTRANDINNNGQIVGHGEFDGKTRAFLLTPTS